MDFGSSSSGPLSLPTPDLCWEEEPGGIATSELTSQLTDKEARVPPKRECLFHFPRLRRQFSKHTRPGHPARTRDHWSLPFGSFPFVHRFENCKHGTEPGTCAAHDAAEQRPTPGGIQPASLLLCTGRAPSGTPPAASPPPACCSPSGTALSGGSAVGSGGPISPAAVKLSACVFLLVTLTSPLL